MSRGTDRFCPHCRIVLHVLESAAEFCECAMCGGRMRLGGTSDRRESRRFGAPIVLMLLLSFGGWLAFRSPWSGGVQRLSSALQLQAPSRGTISSWVDRGGRDCQLQLQQIGRAISAYTTDYGQAPPAVLADGRGGPGHSWRVLLLPYLGREEGRLYISYHFDQPWNSADNISLLQRMPDVYRCAEGECKAGHTSYVALVGAGVFAAPGQSNPAPAVDLALLPAVVDAPDFAVPWLAPLDMDFTLAAVAQRPLRGWDVDAVNILWGDGTTESWEFAKPAVVSDLRSRRTGVALDRAPWKSLAPRGESRGGSGDASRSGAAPPP